MIARAQSSGMGAGGGGGGEEGGGARRKSSAIHNLSYHLKA